MQLLLVKRYIEQKQAEHRNHPFFERLKNESNFHNALAFIPKLTFWVMAFQDILRMVPARVSSKALRRIANHHKIEDSGHDKWFLDDLKYLYPENNYSIMWLFSKENQRIREITHSIVAEVFKASYEHQRVVLILVLESGGHVFFGNVAQYVTNKGFEAYLQYFSNTHLEVEKSHAVFEEELNKQIFSLELSLAERTETIAMIDRVYDGLNTMLDEFLPLFQTAPIQLEELLSEEEPVDLPAPLAA